MRYYNNEMSTILYFCYYYEYLFKNIFKNIYKLFFDDETSYNRLTTQLQRK